MKSNFQHLLDHRKRKGIPKSIYCFSDYTKAFDCVDHNKMWKILEMGILEKEMATHSIILAWRIPWAEQPGRLQSKGS